MNRIESNDERGNVNKNGKVTLLIIITPASFLPLYVRRNFD